MNSPKGKLFFITQTATIGFKKGDIQTLQKNSNSSHNLDYQKNSLLSNG